MCAGKTPTSNFQRFGVRMSWSVSFRTYLRFPSHYGVARNQTHPNMIKITKQREASTGVGIDVLFWGLVSHHLQISVGDYIIIFPIVRWCETLGHLPTPVQETVSRPKIRKTSTSRASLRNTCRSNAREIPELETSKGIEISKPPIRSIHTYIYTYTYMYV